MRKIRNQKGDISLLGILIVLIGITMISSFFNITKKSWVKSELQSILDISTINALSQSIDRDKMREQIYQIKGTGKYIDMRGGYPTYGNDPSYKNVIKTNLLNELKKNIRVSASGTIISCNIKNFDSNLYYTSKGVNSNNSSQLKPQLYMDAVILLDIKNIKDFDDLNSYNLEFKNAISSNISNVTVVETKKDGITTIAVRTTSRIVFK